MFGYSSMPSHFHGMPTYTSSTPEAFYGPSSRSSPFVYRRAQPTYRSYYNDNDEEEDQSEQYAYLDRLRRLKEQRALAEAQARRRAEEEAYLAQRKEQEARARLEAEYAARAQRQRQIERDARLQAQREEQLRVAHAQAEEYRRRQLAAAQQKREAIEAAQQQRRRQIRSSSPYERQQRAQSFFGIPLAAFGPQFYEDDESDEATEQPTFRIMHAPAQQPTAPAKPSEPSMTYEAAVEIVRTRAESQAEIRKRVHDVESLTSRFNELKSAYTQPESFVFDSDKSTDTQPKLAYSPTNRPHQAYVESLTRLLVDLDSIPSGGSQTVKAARKSLAVDIESELARLESLERAAWLAQKSADAPIVAKPLHPEEASAVDDIQVDTTPIATSEEPSDMQVDNETHSDHEDNATDVELTLDEDDADDDATLDGSNPPEDTTKERFSTPANDETHLEASSSTAAHQSQQSVDQAAAETAVSNTSPESPTTLAAPQEDSSAVNEGSPFETVAENQNVIPHESMDTTVSEDEDDDDADRSSSSSFEML